MSKSDIAGAAVGTLLVFVPVAMCYVDPLWGRRVVFYVIPLCLAFIGLAITRRSWLSALFCALSVSVAAGLLYAEVRLLEARIRRSADIYRLAGQEALKIAKEKCVNNTAAEADKGCRFEVGPELNGATTVFYDVSPLLPRHYASLSVAIWAAP